MIEFIMTLCITILLIPRTWLILSFFSAFAFCSYVNSGSVNSLTRGVIFLVVSILLYFFDNKIPRVKIGPYYIFVFVGVFGVLMWLPVFSSVFGFMFWGHEYIVFIALLITYILNLINEVQSHSKLF